MCGIAGIIGCADIRVMNRMLDAIAHRGPDGQGVEVCDRRPDAQPAILGHRRLAVIDLSARGHQPMCNENGTVWVVYNGEVYNFKTIRDELELLGHEFKSDTDTEILVHAYEEWDCALVDRLNGMFAFGIWDETNGELLLGRDRLGVKPLYYCKVGPYFAFASEVKALLEVPGIERNVCMQAFAEYLGLGYVPGPKTMFEGILKLEAGHILRLCGREAVIHRYWCIPYDGQWLEGDLPTQARQFRELLEDAVSIRTISDVPLGTFLSGGIDSSVVTALVAQRCSDRRQLETYCVAYADVQSRHNEQYYANIMASSIGVTCHTASCTPHYAYETLPRLIWHLDEPVAEDLLPPYALLCEQARRSLTVALSGEGADEFLFGYRYYDLERYRRRFSKLPDNIRSVFRRGICLATSRDNLKARALLCALSPTSEESFLEWRSFHDKRERRELYGPGIHTRMLEVDGERPLFSGLDSQGESGAGAAPIMDARYRMVDYVLSRTDKLSMSVALEVRTPFLDYRLVEFMARVPPEHKFRDGHGKLLLRQAAADLIPPAICQRRKKPFAAPTMEWMGPLCDEYMRNSTLVADGLIDGHALRVAHESVVGRQCNTEKLWALVTLEMWYRMFIRQEAAIRDRAASGYAATQ